MKNSPHTQPTKRHLHFNDSEKQSFREDMILWIKPKHDINSYELGRKPETPVRHYYGIFLVVDLPAEIDFTTGLKKRGVILNYYQDKEARDRDLEMFRLSSTTEIQPLSDFAQREGIGE